MVTFSSLISNDVKHILIYLYILCPMFYDVNFLWPQEQQGGSVWPTLQYGNDMLEEASPGASSQALTSLCSAIKEISKSTLPCLTLGIVIILEEGNDETAYFWFAYHITSGI